MYSHYGNNQATIYTTAQILNDNGISTGQLVHEGTGLALTLANSNPIDGGQQMGELMASGRAKETIFLPDSLTALPYEPGIATMMRAGDVHKALLITSPAAAESVVHLLLEHPEIMHEQEIVSSN